MNFDKTSIIGLVIWILCILYSSLRSASRVAQVAIPDPEKQGTECRCLVLTNTKELLTITTLLIIFICNLTYTWFRYLYLGSLINTNTHLTPYLITNTITPSFSTVLSLKHTTLYIRTPIISLVFSACACSTFLWLAIVFKTVSAHSSLFERGCTRTQQR